MINDDTLLRQAESHDIQYELCLIVDEEVVGSVIDSDIEFVTGNIATERLNRELQEYLTDEITSGEEDYHDRHSKDLI